MKHAVGAAMAAKRDRRELVASMLAPTALCVGADHSAMLRMTLMPHRVPNATEDLVQRYARL